MSKTARQGRIYIDYLRNSRGATAVGAYTPRAREGAPVSTPLLWDEVKNSIRPEGFTVDTIPERLARLGSDPWADIGNVRQTLNTTLRRRVGI
jgi:bifunctional non-homologous end joining protein LigD